MTGKQGYEQTPKLVRSAVRFVLVVAYSLAFAFASPTLTAAPASGNLTQKVDRLFAKWDKKDTPGVIVAIAKDGETIHARGYGMANLEHGIALSATTVSESGSVAKQFTAAAVVLLAQRGKLSLDDPIRKHLPEMRQFGDAITVRMLLNHTSGLRDIHGLYELMGRPSYSSFHTNAEVLQVMSRQRQLNFEPGTEYVYCNAAYVLAAVIVQRASGQSFGQFCIEQLFQPLGMNATRWRDDFVAIVPGRAAGYAPRASGGYEIDLPYSNIVGNGGLLTTVGDLLKWNASLDRASGEWGEVVRALETPAKLNDGRALDYALGLTVGEFAGLREVSHGGATSGYRTFLTRFPEQRLSIALLGNTADFNGAVSARELVRTVLGLPIPARPARIQVAPNEVAKHAALYHSARTDALITLTSRDGKLFEGAVELIPTAPRTFSGPTGRAVYLFADHDADGRPGRITVNAGNSITDYTARPIAKPAGAQLAAYTGSYYSEELDVGRTISVRQGRLVVGRWPGASISCEPTFADGFWIGRAWHMTFTRDAQGKVNGFELTNAGGRCRRIKFVRDDRRQSSGAAAEEVTQSGDRPGSRQIRVLASSDARE